VALESWAFKKIFLIIHLSNC